MQKAVHMLQAGRRLVMTGIIFILMDIWLIMKKIGSYYVNSNGAWSTDVPASFSKGVRIGMTEEQVLVSSWGKPTYVNKTTNQYGTYEQWVYRYGNYNSDYLYFENGILTSIQN